ncbi:hypothetical protein FNV43_RR19589 [Rhamnella rubrinervis]|uniref:DUF7950 domain-containing protein n=1 Tax=Rhamnella rubrinervis TaxID=2594499 RepID=A0A8K0DUC4_9ROSA|nr:hypothetical protein FNV43_RR19589 [Rhamnella rubrinervis]
MDGRGGCCIARYSGGGAYDMSKVDRIMLRFRPIAPKPVSTSGSVSGGSATEISDHSVKSGRGKRKYVRDNSNGTNNRRCNNKRRRASPDGKRDEPAVETVVTLPLLPETPEPKDSPARVSPESRDPPMWLSFDSFSGNNNYNNSNNSTNQVDFGVCGSSDRKVLMMQQPVRLRGSCVTVECVTDTCADGNGLGRTDDERKVNLARDTCPGFISDGFGRVAWTNGAYRKMVAGNGEEVGDEMVCLVMKERVPLAVTLTYPAFTCRVRLQYTYGKEKNSLTLPCDVWRMDGGGFAWRLDVEAALCLGR